MKTIKRKAKEGEKIMLTDPQKAFNGLAKHKGLILTVVGVNAKGAYTKEAWPIYMNHEGYEVVVEE